MQNKIIALVGLIGSGKDTVADFLVDDFDFKRESFAGTLKDTISAVFGWDRELLEGKTAAARVWREEVDEWWSTRLNIPNLTPRYVLQYWGTEVCRVGFHTDIWVASLESKLRNSQYNTVITDCRFPNEINSLKKNGAKIIWVKRGPLPIWYETACAANSGDERAKEELKSFNVHASETSWAGTQFDLEINNNGTISDLRDMVNIIAK